VTLIERFSPDASMMRHRRLAGPSVLALALALPVAVQAQTNTAAPETVTPQTLAPEVAPDTAIKLPALQSLSPPPGSEGLRATPAHVLVEGAFPAVADEVAALTRPLEGRAITLAELYRIASEIEALHARAGYVLARVSVPPQRIADGGTVRIVVIDGFLESIDTSALPRRIQSAVAARLAGLRGVRQIRLGRIERQLLLAGDVAGVTLRSTLARGDEAGGVRLIVDGTWRPLRVTARGDNALDRSLGDASGSLQVSANGLLGLGETLYSYAATSDPARPFASDTSVRVFGGGMLVGVGNGRLTLNPEATVSRPVPTAPAGAPRTEGLLVRYAARAGYVLAQTREGRLALDLSLEALDQKTNAIDFDTELARDHYAVARFGASYGRVAPRLAWNVSAQLSEGLGRLGGDTGVPPTRQGAQPAFTKLTAQGRVTYAVAPRLTLSAALFAQSSLGHAMLRAEQFQLEGNDAVSAYVGGITALDDGATLRTEAATRVALGPLALAPYIFAAGGNGAIARPTAVETAHLTAGAFGGGVRSTIWGHFTLGAEYAYGLASVTALDRHGRFNLTASAAF
jgi:hemolysin activation/secretion protein